MLNAARIGLVEALAAFSNAREHGTFSEEDGERVHNAEALVEYADLLASTARALLDELEQPTNLQALALARLLRDFSDTESVSLSTHAFDLPEGYWSVALTSAYDTSTGNRRTFACGIAPDGSVSS